MLKIFNTFTRKKELFKSIFNKKVNLYVCGVTVYDICHIGHGRTFIFFDIVIRYLNYLGFKVNYVRNITDIDDKIILRAVKNNESIQNLTKRIISLMYHDFDQLNILRPNYEPKVTNHINDIINFIDQIIKNGHAYFAKNGDVLFSVNSFKNYGQLSKQNINELKYNYKINFFKFKNNPVDFILWKIAKLGEPSWPSKWGNGRPGWHIECSAINYNQFNKNCDIHGGGLDLIFPHHENEIAQSVCAYKNIKINFWMHVGLVNINNIKISKSLINKLSLNYLLKSFHSETLRYFLMSKHYRNNINFSKKNLFNAEKALTKLYLIINNININNNINYSYEEFFIKEFTDAMNDDFNIPRAYIVLFKIASKFNKLKDFNSKKAQKIAITLRYLANILGLLKEKPIDFLQKTFLQKNIILRLKINKLILKRNNARKLLQWSLADKIRNQLSSMGIILEDKLNNTIWRYK